MFAQTTLLEEEKFTDGVRAATQMLRRAFFRPNILFLHLRPSSDPEALQALIDKTTAYNIGIVLLARDPVVELGREQLINVWVTPQEPDWQHDLRRSNLDLATLLAYKLVRNWNGRLNLCMAVENEETQMRAEQFLQELMNMARLPESTEVHVFVLPFEEALRQAPSADLSVFGLSRKSDLAFSQRIMRIIDRSCVFVRDSGEESALA